MECQVEFKEPLKTGKFLKRYKRFFADIEYNGEVITAHTPNTGSMKSCLFEGLNCRFSCADNPKRKLKYTLEMLQTPTAWVGVHTGHPNKLAVEAFKKGLFSHWSEYQHNKPEAKINDKTRIDLALWKTQDGFGEIKKWNVALIDQYKFHFVEVKNVTLMENELALFPDSVTTRGQKHLLELINLMDQGHTCELLFTVQRSDVKAFSPANEIDPEYAKLLKQAFDKGLVVSPYIVEFSENKIFINPEKKLTVLWP